jgi:hypothetical protein
LIFTCLTLFVPAAYAQNNQPMDDVLNCIRTNRVKDISRYLDNFVPISINNAQSNYSHNQAELVLRDFFDKNPVRDFKIMETGSPGNASRFAIAGFATNGGRYTMYVMMRPKDNSWVVKEIRISKE